MLQNTNIVLLLVCLLPYVTGLTGFRATVFNYTFVDPGHHIRVVFIISCALIVFLALYLLLYMYLYYLFDILSACICNCLLAE